MAGLTACSLLLSSIGLSVGTLSWADDVLEADPLSFSNPVPEKTFYLDPALTKQARKLVHADLKVLAQLPVRPEAGSWFDQVFGGTHASAAIGFLDERVNFFITDSIPLQDRILLSTPKSSAERPITPEYEGLWATDIALNVGTALWMLQLGRPDKDLGLQLGGFRINPNSSRTGIVQIADAYSRNLSLISRLDTLLHEARHSDCTGGMSKEDLGRLRAGELPTNVSCGHFHAVCPPGHPFAGLAACDSHAWGAYAIGGIYSATVASSCGSCKERMIQEALVSSSDSFSRLVTADGLTFAEEMLRGEGEKLDTSSSLGAAPRGRRPDVESLKILRTMGMN